MNKKEINNIDNNILIAETLLKLKVIENLLISKGIINEVEISLEIKDITAKIAKIILQKANVPGDLDSLIKDLDK